MKILNNKGISAVGAALTLLILAALGAVLTYVVATSSVGKGNHISSVQAFYVTQAGIEYGVKRIYEGQNETVNPPGMSFGPGSFTVSRSGRTLTVTGTVGNAVRVYHVDSPTEADCTVIDAKDPELTKGDKRVGKIHVRKICLVTTTIDKMTLSWDPNNGEKLKEIKIEDLIVYSNPAGATSGTLLDIADYILSNPNKNTINWFEFDSKMKKKTFTLSLTMGDGTIKTATFESKD